VVKAEHPKVEYEGTTYTICSEKAAEAVRADPGKYLDDFSG
jgi:YHS domain-containing protein